MKDRTPYRPGRVPGIIDTKRDTQIWDGVGKCANSFLTIETVKTEVDIN